MKLISTYWKRDKSRFLAFLLISAGIILTAFFVLNIAVKEIVNISILLLVFFIFHIIHSAFLKSRAFPEEEKKYLLVTLWNKNKKNKAFCTICDIDTPANEISNILWLSSCINMVLMHFLSF